MNKQTEALKLAEDALKRVRTQDMELVQLSMIALAAIKEALAEQPAPVQQGWKLVPIEPTEDMWKAVNKLDDEMAAGSYDGKGCSIEQAWNCLLNAAPTPPAQRKPLTDEQMADFLGCRYHTMSQSDLEFFRLGEAAHGVTGEQK